MVYEDDKSAPPVAPWRSAGEASASLISDLRFRLQMRKIHALGERPTAELVAELVATFCDTPSEADPILDHFARLSPEHLEVTGADEWPPVPPPRLVTSPDQDADG